MLPPLHMGLFHSPSQLCLYEVLYSFLICLRSLLVLQSALCSTLGFHMLTGPMGKDPGTEPAPEL